jgi:preprotein translocase subunit YajC
MWLQYIVSFFVMFATFLIAFIIPETKQTKQRTENSNFARNRGHQVNPNVLEYRELY